MPRTRAGIVHVLGALLLAPGTAQAQPTPRRVLSLYSYEREFYNVMAHAAATTNRARVPLPEPGA